MVQMALLLVGLFVAWALCMPVAVWVSFGLCCLVTAVWIMILAIKGE